MKPEGEKRSIATKVIAGFLVLFFLIGTTIFLLLSLSDKMQPLREAAEVAGKKASLVNGMLSRLMEMDRLARAYFTSGDPENISAYLQNFESLKSEIETLKAGNSGNRQQRARIKKVEILINSKQATFEKLFGLKRRVVVDSTMRDTILNLAEQLSDTLQTQRTTYQVHTVEHVPVRMPDPPKKAGLFKRMWNSITGEKAKPVETPPLLAKSETKKDTSIIFSVRHDSTARILKDQLIQYRLKELTITKEISEQERHLQNTDQQIANEIRNLLQRIEQDELKRSVEQARQSAELQSRLYAFSVTLGIVALTTILVFSLFIGRDLTRSEYYKRELVAARLLAEEHLRVKEQFLATMSHEIRTPITAIIGFAEQLEQTNLDAKQQSYQTIIAQSSVHLLGLVNDILDYSKIEAGMLKLESIPIAPNQALTDAWNLIYMKGVEKGLAMECYIQFPEHLLLNGDPLRLRQILINLLGNAIKFTEHGSIKLSANAEQTGQTSWQLNIMVADTGIGIPEEMQNNIFKEFTQSDPGITRKFGGTGLGLAICKRLVEMQGGTIGVHSVLSQGSEFKVTLPFETAVEGSELPSQQAKGSITSLNGYAILLVEDDSTTLLLTKGILEKHGAKVVTATNGIEALEKLRLAEMHFSLIISDVNMPEMSGPELIASIRKEEAFNAIPALCTSATNTDSDIQQYLKAGFNAVLTKPFYEQELLSKLALLLGEQIQLISSEKKEKDEENLTFSGIKQFTGEDEEAYKDILQSLLENLNQAGEQIPLMLEENNQKQLAELAHKLLPHFRNLGIKDGAALLSEIEMLRKESTNDLSYLHSLATQFQEQISDATKAIQQEIS